MNPSTLMIVSIEYEFDCANVVKFYSLVIPYNDIYYTSNLRSKSVIELTR